MSPAAEPEVEFRFVHPPRPGLWRIARGDDPLRPSVLHPDDADLVVGGNRFDSLEFGTLYFATDLEGCFAETLARYRPSARMLAALEDDADWRDRGFMAPGSVPADWRHRRIALRARIAPRARFLDVEAPETQTVLTEDLARELDELGVERLDVAVVRGHDRRVTRLLADWAYGAIDSAGQPAFAGIRCVSRLGDHECRAIFERSTLEVVERRTITLSLAPLQRTSASFGLRVF